MYGLVQTIHGEITSFYKSVRIGVNSLFVGRTEMDRSISLPRKSLADWSSASIESQDVFANVR